MSEFSTLLQQDNAWFFIPSAILLDALYGLEPGHPKTMVVVFTIATKGIIKRAAMLGLTATLPYTAVVWSIALGGMYIGKTFTAQTAELWLQFVSVIVIFGTAFWMLWRAWQGERNRLAQTHHDYDHGHHHHHDYDDHHHDHDDDHHHYYHRHHYHYYHEHEHNHDHTALAGLTEGSKECQDAHERAHAADAQRRFAGKEVASGRVLLLGLTGGLILCPVAITVLLICIQLKVFTLGVTMMLYFNLGLALTLITVGVGAAISVQQAVKRWSGFNTMARKAPYFSSVLITMVGLYMGTHGYMGIVS